MKHLYYKRGLWYFSLTRSVVKITATFHVAVVYTVGDAQCKTRELFCVRMLIWKISAHVGCQAPDLQVPVAQRVDNTTHQIKIY